jgi:hypothetical protein
LFGGAQLRQLSGKLLRRRFALGLIANLIQSDGAQIFVLFGQKFDDHLHELIIRFILSE